MQAGIEELMETLLICWDIMCVSGMMIFLKKVFNYLVFQRGNMVSGNSSIIMWIGSNIILKNISLEYENDSYVSLIHPNSNTSKNIKFGKLWSFYQLEKSIGAKRAFH